jgi:hypothetical protein
MAFLLGNTIDFCKKNVPLLFLLLVLGGSFFLHAGWRTQHFQECDSSSVYGAIKDVSGITASISAKAASAGGGDKGLYDTIKGWRLRIRTSLLTMPLPHAITSALALPFMSTYSFGSGLAYFLLVGGNASYEGFMSGALLITLLLFHTSVFLVYWISCRCGLSKGVSLLASLLMLFSISMYSYGYHLGSTVWNYSTELIWLAILVRYWQHPKILSRISVTTAILIFFNYLIMLFWLSFLAVKGVQRMKKNENIVLAVVRLATSQWVAILAIGACAFLFYPPGQGNRVSTSATTFLSDFYYVVLNFFSFYNANRILDVVQFGVGFSLLCGGVWWMLCRRDVKSPAWGFAKIALALLGVFILAAFGGILGFAPSRHILFLAPVIFMGVAGSLQSILKQPKAYVYACAFISIIGFSSLFLRHELVRAAMIPGRILTDLQEVRGLVVQHCSTDTLYRVWPIVALDLSNEINQLQKGEYIYGSQMMSLDQAALNWRDMGYDVRYAVLENGVAGESAYFTAYSTYADRLGPKNQIFFSRFKITDITPTR